MGDANSVFLSNPDLSSSGIRSEAAARHAAEVHVLLAEAQIDQVGIT